ncbi:MAG: hypothetical protein AAF599_00130 [Bacteroidota bacterium]
MKKKMIGDEHKEHYRGLIASGDIELCLLLMRSNEELLLSSFADSEPKCIKRYFRKTQAEFFILGELRKLHNISTSEGFAVGDFLKNFCGFHYMDTVRYFPKYRELKSIHYIITEQTTPQDLMEAYSEVKKKMSLLGRRKQHRWNLESIYSYHLNYVECI